MHLASALDANVAPKRQTKRWLWLPAIILVAIAGAYFNLVSQSGASVWFDAITGALAATLLTLLVACALWLTLATAHWFVQEQHSESPVAELVSAYPETTNQALMEPGSYSVEHFTYGSGNAKRRVDYAENVRFQTPSVDASKMLESWSGWRGRLRSRAWGFSADELPLNAQVWYPRPGRRNSAR